MGLAKEASANPASKTKDAWIKCQEGIERSAAGNIESVVGPTVKGTAADFADQFTNDAYYGQRLLNKKDWLQLHRYCSLFANAKEFDNIIFAIGAGQLANQQHPPFALEAAVAGKKTLIVHSGTDGDILTTVACGTYTYTPESTACSCQ